MVSKLIIQSAELTSRQYEKRVNLIEDLYDFHPEYFQALTPAQRGALSVYYFAERDVNVESVHQYRREVLSNNPELAVDTDDAFRALLLTARIHHDDGEQPAAD